MHQAEEEPDMSKILQVKDQVSHWAFFHTYREAYLFAKSIAIGKN